MRELFEYSDALNSPVEAFVYDTEKNEFPVQSHWHYFAELIFMIKGHAVITCNSQRHELNPSEMLFIQPQVIHSIYSADNEPLQYFVVKFDMGRLSHPNSYIPKFNALFMYAAKDLSIPVKFTQENFGTFSLTEFFTKCIREVSEKQYGYDAYLECKISMLLLEILRIWRSVGFHPETYTYAEENNYSIHDILEYIDKHSHENIQVKMLADMCHMSYSYFAKTFNKLYGQSCKEYIEFIRLSKAENYLLFTNYDLNYISSETGFSDCSHLIRIFKRKFGITPKQFRLKHLK